MDRQSRNQALHHAIDHDPMTRAILCSNSAGMLLSNPIAPQGLPVVSPMEQAPILLGSVEIGVEPFQFSLQITSMRSEPVTVCCRGIPSSFLCSWLQISML